MQVMFERRYAESILVHASPAGVWRVLSDLSRLPEWYYPSRRVQLPGSRNAQAGAQFVLWIRTAAGIVVRAPGEVLQVEPERLLQWRGRSSGIAATATWTLAPQDGQTRLTHEFAGGGWMMLLSTLSGRAPRTARKRLENLKRVVEQSNT
jgi:uncharacterized protein YndB with AHSA1/START domain